MFIVLPVGGLGNRMRVIDSAIRFGQQRKINVLVRWYYDPEMMACRWDDLFQPVGCIRPAGKFMDVLKFVRKLKRRSGLFRCLLGAMSKIGFLKIFYDDEWAALRSAVSSGKKWLFMIAESSSIFWWPEGEKFQSDLFLLTPELQKRVDNEINGFGTGTVGIHIRRTDNEWSKESSPDELFITAMKKEPSDHKFYLCSDDAEVKERLVSEFGVERVRVPAGVLNRDSVEGIKQATVELFALSYTTKIYGSYYSSFSEMASYLSGVELQILKV